MMPFVEWMKHPDHGFWVQKTWDRGTGKWVAGKGYKLELFPHQERIFDYCMRLTKDGTFPHQTVIVSCPKKSGKTTLAAATVAWYADQVLPGSEVYMMASTKQQAENLAYTDLIYHYTHLGLEPTQYRIRLPNGTKIDVLSSRYTSAAGLDPALVVWDELWNFTSDQDRRLYEEMTIPPTQPCPLQLIVTYAGFDGESDLLWNFYKLTVLDGDRVESLGDLPCYVSKDGSIFAYWDHEPRMPWQTQIYYDSELQRLRPNQFLRLHRNEWVSPQDQFIDMALWDRAVTLKSPLIFQPDSPYRQYPISIAVDAGLKHDCTAVVGVYYDLAEKKIGLAFHQIWTPQSGTILDLEETVEKYLREMFRTFNIYAILCDPSQMLRSITALQKEGLPIIEFYQTDSNMIPASQNLFEILKYRILQVYPDEELRMHIKLAVAEQKKNGYRLTRPKSLHDRLPIDAAIALAMACYDAVKRGGVDTRGEIVIESPFSDASGIKHISSEEENLPWPFRD